MEIDVMHRMMADSGEGERESGEEGNEEDYTNHNKQQRWKSGDREGSSTHNMVNLCRSSAGQASSSSIVQGRESEGTLALDDQSSFSGEAELPMRQCGEVK